MFLSSQELSEDLNLIEKIDSLEFKEIWAQVDREINKSVPQTTQLEATDKSEVDLKAAQEKDSVISTYELLEVAQNSQNAVEDDLPLNSYIRARYHEELTFHIGPIAELVLNETITKYPQIGAIKLVEKLSQERPEIPKKAIQALEKLIDTETVDIVESSSMFGVFPRRLWKKTLTGIMSILEL